MTENDQKSLEKIEGSVEQVMFRNENNGYIVLDLNTGDDLVTVTGELGDIEEGEELVIEGFWEEHIRFGRQLRAVYCERKLPTSVWSIRKYLEGGAIKGVGKVLADRIVDVFGADTLRVLEEEPSRLNEVRGITPKKAEKIAEECRKLFALRAVTTELAEYKIRAQYAFRAFQCYSYDTLSVVKENPYILCSDRIDLDFSKADRMGRDYGFKLNSDERIFAAVCSILKENSFEGHTCLPLEKTAKIAARLDIDEKNFYRVCTEAVKDRTLFQVIKDDREFLFLPDYYHAETFIADRMKMLCDFSNPETEDFSKEIDLLEKESGITYDEQQREAIDCALSKNVMILTGGPGTGKTTTLNAIIAIYRRLKQRVFLTAPTGRAAKRMSDLTGEEAKTIHRLLEVEFEASGRPVFRHNEKSPLSCDVIVVDEMSMVDELLFDSLLRALKLSCKIVLVGDVNQLPPVGAGNLLKDLIYSRKIPVIALKKIFRQAQQSRIVMNAHKILKGETPEIGDKKSDFFFFQRLDAPKATELILDLAADRLPKAYGISAIDDIQIIAPSRKGLLGIQELNKSLQSRLNPGSETKAEHKTALYIFREGDKVMQNKNNYDILWKQEGETGQGIFNGDIGRITMIDKARHVAVIDFDGRVAVYPFALLSQIELAYAVTVHKSQGSEFEVVIMPVLDQYKKLCDRSLLYTGVTRAKKLLILVGSVRELTEMTANVRKNIRYTCLRKMLEEGTDAVEFEAGQFLAD